MEYKHCVCPVRKSQISAWAKCNMVRLSILKANIQICANEANRFRTEKVWE